MDERESMQEMQYLLDMESSNLLIQPDALESVHGEKVAL